MTERISLLYKCFFCKQVFMNFVNFHHIIKLINLVDLINTKTTPSRMLLKNNLTKFLLVNKLMKTELLNGKSNSLSQFY